MPHDYWLTRDWWHAPNLTHTRIDCDDGPYASGTGGALAAIYPASWRRRVLSFAGVPIEDFG